MEKPKRIYRLDGHGICVGFLRLLYRCLGFQLVLCMLRVLTSPLALRSLVVESVGLGKKSYKGLLADIRVIQPVRGALAVLDSFLAALIEAPLQRLCLLCLASCRVAVQGAIAATSHGAANSSWRRPWILRVQAQYRNSTLAGTLIILTLLWQRPGVAAHMWATSCALQPCSTR